MNVLLAFLILSAPFALAALLSWASHRNDAVRGHLVNQFGDPDWYRVQKTDDPQAPDPGTYEVHNHYYGTGQNSSAPAGEGAGRSRNRGSLTAWWASLTPLQRFILHNGSAATAGAWGWGWTGSTCRGSTPSGASSASGR